LKGSARFDEKIDGKIEKTGEVEGKEGKGG
jgi:hypothetical protein